MENLPIHNILASVTDKTKLAEFISGLSLVNPNLKVVATGSSAKNLKENGLNPTLVEDYTGLEECFSGRVKTIHPKIAGGILLDKTNDIEEAKKLNIDPFDMVVCNLYDFKGAKDQNLPLEELINFIDIGGVTLIRAAAKNFKNVVVLTSADDYIRVLDEIKDNRGISLKTRSFLAAKAFKLTAEYEIMISSSFSLAQGESPVIYNALHNQKELRYGENPSQKGWIFQFKGEKGIAHSMVLSGKELSYNNYEDATIALNAATELKEVLGYIGVAVVKHGSLCGLATAETVKETFDLAWDADSKSAFGSVIAINDEAKEELCDSIKDKFIEVIVAKDFSNAFVSWAKKHKPMLRLIVADFEKETVLFKKVSGGMLSQTSPITMHMQEVSDLFAKGGDLKKGIVTRGIFPDELKELTAFSLIATKYVKSNAIVIGKKIDQRSYQTIGIGSGQPNRIDSMELLAIPKALKKSGSMKNCILASDGFFPFADSIESASKVNIKWIVQPGGSKKDLEVIEKANECQIGMIFTGQRLFSH